MRILIIAAAATGIVSGTAGAQTMPTQQPINPGEVQLARTAGVPPGRYSLAQLNQLIEAESFGHTAQINYILRQPKDQAAEDAILKAAHEFDGYLCDGQ